MPTLDELQRQRKDKASLIEDIQKGAKASDRDPTEDENEKIDATLEEIDGLDAQIKTIQDNEKRSARIAGVVASQDLTSAQTKKAVTDLPASDIVVSDPEWTKSPTMGFEKPRDFLHAVMLTGNGMPKDKRLKALHAPDAAAGSDEHSTFSDPYGGFTVPEAWAPGIMMVDPEDDPTDALVQKVPMTTQVVHFNARTDKNHTSSVTGGLQVYWRAEADTSTATRMEFEQVKLEASGLLGLSYATEELLARSNITFTAMLANAFSQEFAKKKFYSRLYGTGVGQYEGIEITPSKVAVAKETGQTAATIVLENIMKMRSRCWGYGKAIWIANHDCLPDLMSMVFDTSAGTKTPIWITSAREGEPDMLFGRPLYLSEYCETIGTEGDIVLVNWSDYIEGTLTNLQGADSIHVRFVNHERTFKWWMETGAIHSWRSALTPMKSSTTLSPVVRLAVRA